VLIEIAARLQGAVRGTDTVGRIGADHFVALCEPLAGTAAVVAAAERLLQVCREPVVIDGRTIHLTASVGVAVGGHPEDDPESLLRDADSALAVAKRRGRDRHELFEEGVRDLLLWRLDTEQGLHQALANGEFELHYQPIWDLDSGRIVAAEALLRWNHPERGLIPPPEFFSVAEDSGMIVPIGDWVLKEACAQRAEWSDVPGGEDFRTVWVNVSAVQLTRADFPAKVSAALDAHGLRPQQVGLEITETVLMEADDISMAGLEELHRLGCPIAIDDFGTGYASLTYLRRLRSDLVKIDQSFVARMTSSPEDRSIVAAVIDLSHALALRVSAEGVETLEQLEALHELGCDTACGYLLARPGSPEVLRGLLVEQVLLPTTG
jgi:EAL domain-containing protein (putative c-di-GMP-specific phosphodiesterase class I)